jgi:hypothetical protein
MSQNPFLPPPKPPKKGTTAQSRPRNPFDDEDDNGEVVVTFSDSSRGVSSTANHQNSVPPPAIVPQGRSVQRPSDTSSKRVFGGGIPNVSTGTPQQPTSLLTKAREQLHRPSASSPNGSSSIYSRVTTDTTEPDLPSSARRQDVQAHNVRTTHSPIAARSAATTQSTASNVSQSPPLRAPPAAKKKGIFGQRGLAAPEVSGYNLVEDRGLELTEAGLRTEQTNNNTNGNLTGNKKMKQKGNSNGIQDSALEHMATDSEAGPSNDNNGKAQKASKKQKQRKPKVRKTIFCVDSKDENAVIRHLLSERGNTSINQLSFCPSLGDDLLLFQCMATRTRTAAGCRTSATTCSTTTRY